MHIHSKQIFNGKQLGEDCKQLIETSNFLSDPLIIIQHDVTIKLYCQQPELLQQLKDYFSAWTGEQTNTVFEVYAIDHPQFTANSDFIDWPRETGKMGRKERYLDFDDGRLVYKHKTGMLFVQSPTYRLAIGPCLQHANQLINFINNQSMNWLQQRGYLICHAAAVVHKRKAYAFAAFSGGGKSSQMLFCLDNPEVNFLTNDRLFIKYIDHSIQAAGVAKHPRINPGTIIGNPALSTLISSNDKQQLLNLSADELWNLEQKHDVNIESMYGSGRIRQHATLSALVILNWQHHSERPCQVEKVNLNKRPELLKAVMKSKGPFYYNEEGDFLDGQEMPDTDKYIDIFDKLDVYEVSGLIDFHFLSQYFNHTLIEE